VRYALNLEPGAQVSDRTVERYQKQFREDETAARIFDDVTGGLTEKLELDVSRQRLDSTHVFSNMATFGRQQSRNPELGSTSKSPRSGGLMVESVFLEPTDYSAIQ